MDDKNSLVPVSGVPTTHLDAFLHEDKNSLIVFGRKKLDLMINDIWSGKCKEIDIEGLSGSDIAKRANELFEKNGLSPIFHKYGDRWESVTGTYLVFEGDRVN